MKPRCVETRTTAAGIKRRLYQTAAGITFTTYEVPSQVFRSLSAKAVKLGLASAARALERKTRNQTALLLMRGGWKPIAAALEAGICESQARRIRARGKP